MLLYDAKKLLFGFLDNHNIMKWINPTIECISIPKTWTTGKCSLTSFSKPIKHISTKGLKYDLDCSLELGKNISLSNTMMTQEIRIKTSDPVLFIAEVQEERHIIPLE